MLKETFYTNCASRKYSKFSGMINDSITEDVCKIWPFISIRMMVNIYLIVKGTQIFNDRET